ncbi:MAG TPA: ethanolamine ammonia-lyase subunit EutB, partial [Polyangia bacterium]|nr:ethanolamine ammonia-lyase subunit EutB [Polyangia bacterium]
RVGYRSERAHRAGRFGTPAALAGEDPGSGLRGPRRGLGPVLAPTGARQITRAGLEDHFMGKLHGISMGCDACYTNHADADQNDLENLEVLLTAAGCNFFMGLPMGDDVMLNYQSTSFHDDATLRQLFGFRPAPEFEGWLEQMEIMRDGKLTERAGDPSLFG